MSGSNASWMAGITLAATILISVITGWFSWSNSQTSTDANLVTRVGTLEKLGIKTEAINDRFIVVESAVDHYTVGIQEHDKFDRDIDELEKQVAVLESQIKDMREDGRTSRLDVSDIKVTLSNIVIILKGRGDMR